MKLSKLSFLFFCLPLLAFSECHGYGLLSRIDSSSEGYLIENMMSGREIKYAVVISDEAKYSDVSIQTQIEVALEQWMEPFRKIGIPNPGIQRVFWRNEDLDLMVLIGPRHPDPQNTMSTATQNIMKLKNGRKFISTIYIPEEIDDLGEVVPVVDFIKLMSSPSGFRKKLLKLVHKKNFDITDSSFAREFGISKVYNSTYNIILHELGHAFGLADTQPDELEELSNRQDRSETQTSESVMYHASYFTPQPDDWLGIKYLVKKYLSKAHPALAKRCQGTLQNLDIRRLNYLSAVLVE